MWWMAAAAAAPYLMSALQKKPKAPGAPAFAPLKNRDAEIEDMMRMASDPHAEQYKLAADQAIEQVNRVLAKQGLGGSSLGAQLHSNTQSKLAQAWMEEQLRRKEAALQVALEYDKGQAGWNQQGNNAAYNYAMDQYKNKQQSNANQIQGISNMINMGVSAYNQDRMMTAYENATKPPQQPIYGSPGDVTTYSSYDAPAGASVAFNNGPQRAYGGSY